MIFHLLECPNSGKNKNHSSKNRFMGKALLIIGIALSLWGRSLSHDDQVALGLKTAGQIGLRSAAGAVSLYASEGTLKLGKDWAFETSFKKGVSNAADHKGFNVAFSKPMSWQVRVPIVVIAVLAGVFLLFKGKMARG